MVLLVILLVGLDLASSVHCSGLGLGLEGLGLDLEGPGLGLSLKDPGLGLEGPGLGLEGPGLGLEGPGLGLGPSGLVNIPAGGTNSGRETVFVTLDYCGFDWPVQCSLFHRWQQMHRLLSKVHFI